MKIQCPHCNQEYEIDESCAKQTAECKGCEKTFSNLQRKEQPELQATQHLRKKKNEDVPLNPKQIIFYLALAVLTIFGLFSCDISCNSNAIPPKENYIVSNRLAYLTTEIPELVRCDFLGNDVYISFADDCMPYAYKSICNAAAVWGSEELVKKSQTITRCSVWVIPKSAPAGNVNKVYYNVNARNGKIQ